MEAVKANGKNVFVIAADEEQLSTPFFGTVGSRPLRRSLLTHNRFTVSLPLDVMFQ